MKNGSVDNLKVRCRWGCIPNRLNHRCTVLFETPVCAAIVRSVQCVPPAGVDCKAVLMTSATRSSSWLRGAPGTQFVVQPFKAILEIAFAPFDHGVLVQSQPRGDGDSRFALGASEHDLGALHQAMWQGVRLHEAKQLTLFIRIE